MGNSTSAGKPRGCKTIAIVTYGWPLVTVARDGVGGLAKDKGFGIKGL